MTPEQFCYWLKGYLCHNEINLEAIQKELEATLTKKQVVPSLLDQYKPVRIGDPPSAQSNLHAPDWNKQYKPPWVGMEDSYKNKS